MEITRLLRAVEDGDHDAMDRLFSAVYEELRNVARGQRARWQGNATLDTTGLVHEAYLRMSRRTSPAWEDRGHFFAVASRAMRQVLINYAEMQRAAKRGGGVAAESLEARHTPVEGAPNPVPTEAVEDLLLLEAALRSLEGEQPRWVRVIECRFFSGLTVEETAEALGLSRATVKRDWSQARAWLGRALAEAGVEGGPSG
jgi:RNA polymerase sigma factor (TIGR02999 family)